MTTRRRGGRWIYGALAGLLVALTPWPGDWPEGKEAKAVNPGQGNLDKRLNITVRQGRLSVDLKDADIGEVLAQIGTKAGITILFEPPPGKQVGTQFTDVELDSGLRRLLRLAAFNHAILYGQGSAGAVTIQEVRVFAESTRATVQQSPTLAQAQPVPAPPVTGEQSEAARRFREALEGAKQQRPQTGGEESDAARRFREALEKAKPETPSSAGGAEIRPQPLSPATGEESEAARRFREALEKAKQRGN